MELFAFEYKNIIIISGYKSRKTPINIFTECFEKILQNYDDSLRFILLGDFNFDTYTKNSWLENFLLKYNFNRGLSENQPTTFQNSQIDTIFNK